MIKTPEMTKPVGFASYSNPGKDRPRLFDVLPDVRTKSSMGGTASRENAAIKAADLLVRNIHAYSHDNVPDMK